MEKPLQGMGDFPVMLSVACPEQSRRIEALLEVLTRILIYPYGLLPAPLNSA
jgi:hypothetical protein